MFSKEYFINDFMRAKFYCRICHLAAINMHVEAEIAKILDSKKRDEYAGDLVAFYIVEAADYLCKLKQYGAVRLTSTKDTLIFDKQGYRYAPLSKIAFLIVLAGIMQADSNSWKEDVDRLLGVMEIIRRNNPIAWQQVQEIFANPYSRTAEEYFFWRRLEGKTNRILREMIRQEIPDVISGRLAVATHSVVSPNRPILRKDTVIQVEQSRLINTATLSYEKVIEKMRDAVVPSNKTKTVRNLMQLEREGYLRLDNFGTDEAKAKEVNHLLNTQLTVNDFVRGRKTFCQPSKRRKTQKSAEQE